MSDFDELDYNWAHEVDPFKANRLAAIPAIITSVVILGAVGVLLMRTNWREATKDLNHREALRLAPVVIVTCSLFVYWASYRLIDYSLFMFPGVLMGWLGMKRVF